MRYFNTKFLKEADNFIKNQNVKIIRKILYNIDLAEQTNDPKLFKKLNDKIWEFRILYSGKKIRLLAFWDKRNKTHTLVIATHGFIKKTDKIPGKEINRAENLKIKYFKEK